MLKKIFSVLMLLTLIIFATPAQAQEIFDLNRDFNSQLVPLADVRNARVVNIKTFLSIRAEPTVYSREVLRIYNGESLSVTWIGDPNWWYVVYYQGMRNLGYVNSRYIRVY